METNGLLQEALALCHELELLEVDSDEGVSAEEMEEEAAEVDDGSPRAQLATDREMAVELQRTLSASRSR